MSATGYILATSLAATALSIGSLLLFIIGGIFVVFGVFVLMKPNSKDRP